MAERCGATVTDVAVVGCGPAGSAAAIILARSGANVTAFEREAGAHAKVCGEFISSEACDELLELGVDPFALGAARIDRVRVSTGRASVVSRLPFTAASLSRATLDEALLERAIAAGATVRRGTRVVAIERGANARSSRIRARTGDGEEVDVRASDVVLASGKTELAGFRRGLFAGDALGFKTHIALDESARAELGSAVELTLFAGGYAGMQAIEAGLFAFALVVERAAFARLGSWRTLLEFVAKGNPAFAQRLTGMREVWPKPLAVSGVPYGFVYRDEPGSASDVYRIGDQFAVIPSFTGDGMAIALVTGSCAARALARGEHAARFHATMRERIARPMTVARAFARAIRSPIGRRAVVWPARAVPALFTLAAAQTRIPRATTT